MEQVWFTGCHGDVGGGTPPGTGVDGTTSLCDITLAWMMAKAQTLGLTFDPAVAAKFQTIASDVALDAIHESYGPQDGPIHLRPIADNANVSNSVALRVQLALGDYAPGNLKIADGALADSYTLVDMVDAGAAVTTP
jgi:hypothetical protein